ncbi:MAG TPA: hypothetical protein VF006_13370 [Longimicrobium sp.]
MMNIVRTCCAMGVLALTGCDWILPSLDGNPRLCARKPVAESLVDEPVIVRVFEVSDSTRRLYLDRVKFLASADSSRSINRVVIAELAAPGSATIGWGDTLRVTTTFLRLVRAGGYEFYISDWPANEGDCWDGAWVSLHRLENSSHDEP